MVRKIFIKMFSKPLLRLTIKTLRKPKLKCSNTFRRMVQRVWYMVYRFLEPCFLLLAHWLVYYLFRPLSEGEELYTQMGFFVQTILADRYNNRRVLWVISLESPSSVEYGIKEIFSIFGFTSIMLKLLIEVLLILSLKIEEGFWILRSEFFASIYAKFLKIQTFLSKKWLF